MTDFKKLRLAVIAGLAVPSLALTACSSDDSGSHSDSSTSDSRSAADAGNAEIEIDLAGAPDGFELTPADTRLSFGDTAQVLTQNRGGVLQFWDVTVSGLKDLPADAMELQDEDTDVDHFVCVNYEMTLLGTAENPDFTPDPEDDADTDYSTLPSAPEMGILGEDDRMANSIIGGGAEECDISDGDVLGYRLDEVEEGKVYRDADVSFVTTGTGTDAGNKAVGGKFDYSYALEDLGLEGTIYWED
ncbi:MULTISPECIES: hypothetical protein [unclassified Corynebacterium]|uniref:hypothetical protein n=1 Tax=unclassified Corynebacterium TaxID=2624378 RepID=UPI0030AD8892